MQVAALAGLAYVVIIFAAGFVLGTLRAILLAPLLGEAPAVLLELPVMLALSWLVCGWLIGRFGVAPRRSARLVMGGVAFAVLMVFEFALGRFAFGWSLAEHLARYREPSGLIGLIAQLAFAAFPLMARRSGGIATR